MLARDGSSAATAPCFKGTVSGLRQGSNTLTLVAFERTGTRGVNRVTAVLP